MKTDGAEYRIMKFIRNKNYLRYRFDFDIGYLTKSPCKNCEDRDLFPQCLKECEIIDQIHEVLTESISCSKG